MSQPGRPPPDGMGYDAQETQAFDTVERAGRAGDTAPLPIVPRIEHPPLWTPVAPTVEAPVERTAAETIGQGIAFAALMLMIGNILSRILGLVREQVAAGFFGTTRRR